MESASMVDPRLQGGIGTALSDSVLRTLYLDPNY